MKNKTSNTRKKNKNAVKKQETKPLAEFPAFTKPVPWWRNIKETEQAIRTYTWLTKVCSCTDVVENVEYTVQDIRVGRDCFHALWQEICRSIRASFFMCGDEEELEQRPAETLATHFGYDMQGYREIEGRQWAVRVLPMWRLFPDCSQTTPDYIAMMYLAVSTMGMVLPCAARGARLVLVFPEMNRALRDCWESICRTLRQTFEGHGFSVVYEFVSKEDFDNRLHMMTCAIPYENCLDFDGSAYRSIAKDSVHENSYLVYISRSDLKSIHTAVENARRESDSSAYQSTLYFLLDDGMERRIFTYPAEHLVQDLIGLLAEENTNCLRLPVSIELSIRFETGAALMGAAGKVCRSRMQLFAKSERDGSFFDDSEDDSTLIL